MFVCRRNHYQLYKRRDTDICPLLETGFNAARHITIMGNQAAVDCLLRFPCAIQLTLNDYNAENRPSFIDDLNRIVPLAQLTRLVIMGYSISISKLPELLYHVPNTHSLTFSPMPKLAADFETKQHMQNASLIPQTNKIAKVTIEDDCTLHHINFLGIICPRMECLTTRTTKIDDLYLIIRFLVQRSASSSQPGFSFCVRNVDEISFKELRTTIFDEKLLNDYLFERVNRGLYLCW